MESLLERASVKRAVKTQSRREVLDHLDFTEKQLQLVTVEMKDKICKMVEEVEHKVCIYFQINNCISRLFTLHFMNRFNIDCVL
jgi:hypothetical protein